MPRLRGWRICGGPERFGREGTVLRDGEMKTLLAMITETRPKTNQVRMDMCGLSKMKGSDDGAPDTMRPARASCGYVNP
jgi:hypothetical protein